MNRRHFCKHLSATAGALAFTSLINACSPKDRILTPTDVIPYSSSTPTKIEATVTLKALTTKPASAPTREMILATEESSPTPRKDVVREDQTEVALVRTTDRSTGINQAIHLLGVNTVSGRPVLLKPNLNSADPTPGSTDTQTLKAIVNTLLDIGAGDITLCDRSGMGNTRAVMEQKGIFGLADQMGFDVTVLDELTANDWVIRKDAEFNWSQGIPIPKLLLDSECVIQTCNLKTHQYGGHFTMSLKNSVGFVAKNIDNGHDFMRELHGSPYQRQMIAEINALYHPALIIMDGIKAFVDGGPAHGKEVHSEVILVGTDPVAMDAIGVAILRLFGTTREVSQGNVFEQDQIARAVELGLGVQGPGQIHFITPDEESYAYAVAIKEELSS